MATGVEKTVIDDLPSFFNNSGIGHQFWTRLGLQYLLVFAAVLGRRRRWRWW